MQKEEVRKLDFYGQYNSAEDNQNFEDFQAVHKQYYSYADYQPNSFRTNGEQYAIVTQEHMASAKDSYGDQNKRSLKQLPKPQPYTNIHCDEDSNQDEIYGESYDQEEEDEEEEVEDFISQSAASDGQKQRIPLAVVCEPEINFAQQNLDEILNQLVQQKDKFIKNNQFTLDCGFATQPHQSNKKRQRFLSSENLFVQQETITFENRQEECNDLGDDVLSAQDYKISASNFGSIGAPHSSQRNNTQQKNFENSLSNKRKCKIMDGLFGVCGQSQQYQNKNIQKSSDNNKEQLQLKELQDPQRSLHLANKLTEKNSLGCFLSQASGLAQKLQCTGPNSQSFKEAQSGEKVLTSSGQLQRIIISPQLIHGQSGISMNSSNEFAFESKKILKYQQRVQKNQEEEQSMGEENKSNFLKIKNKPSELNTSLGIKIGEGITSREVQNGESYDSINIVIGGSQQNKCQQIGLPIKYSLLDGEDETEDEDQNEKNNRNFLAQKLLQNQFLQQQNLKLSLSQLNNSITKPPKAKIQKVQSKKRILPQKKSKQTNEFGLKTSRLSNISINRPSLLTQKNTDLGQLKSRQSLISQKKNDLGGLKTSRYSIRSTKNPVRQKSLSQQQRPKLVTNERNISNPNKKLATQKLQQPPYPSKSDIFSKQLYYDNSTASKLCINKEVQKPRRPSVTIEQVDKLQKEQKKRTRSSLKLNQESQQSILASSRNNLTTSRSILQISQTARANSKSKKTDQSKNKKPIDKQKAAHKKKIIDQPIAKKVLQPQSTISPQDLNNLQKSKFVQMTDQGFMKKKNDVVNRYQTLQIEKQQKKQQKKPQKKKKIEDLEAIILKIYDQLQRYQQRENMLSK